LVALPLSLVAGWLATLLGFWSIFLAAFAGTLIGRIAFRAAGRRRGRWLPHVVTACVIIGAVLPALPFVVGIFFGQFSLRLLFTGIYIVMATGATYYQMR
jgi:ABC-type dipeptide/oligopeptide/nickel transport system permease component